MLRSFAAQSTRQWGNRLRKVAVGTTKKSTETRAATWLLKECAPALRGWFGTARHETRNGALRNVESQLEQLAMNAWRAPRRIGERHGMHEIRKLGDDRWSTDPPAA